MKISYLSLSSLRSLLTGLALISTGAMLSLPSFASLAPVESRNNSGSSNVGYGHDNNGNSGNSESIVPPPTVFMGRSQIQNSSNKSANDPSSTARSTNSGHSSSNASANSNVNANANANASSAAKARTSGSNYPMTAQDRAAHLTLSQIENLQRELGELRGLVETQDHTIKQLKKSQQDLYLDLERRINQLQTAGQRSTSATNAAPTAVSTSTPPSASTATAVSSSTSKAVSVDKKINKSEKGSKAASTSASAASSATDLKPAAEKKPIADLEASKNKKPAKEKTAPSTPPDAIKPNVQAKSSGDQEAYQHAYGFVRSKQYPEAVSALQDYLSRFKKGEQAPQAHYWLGEVYMLQWQNDKNNIALLDKAEHEFSSITSEYPNHPKTADALLKLGLIEIDKGNPDSATQYLSEVKTRYPGSAAARIADNKLQQLAAD